MIDALHQKLKKNPKLFNSAKTTDPVIFTESIFPQIFGDTAMESYTESQESYESLFQDKNKYNAITDEAVMQMMSTASYWGNIGKSPICHAVLSFTEVTAPTPEKALELAEIL